MISELNKYPNNFITSEGKIITKCPSGKLIESEGVEHKDLDYRCIIYDYKNDQILIKVVKELVASAFLSNPNGYSKIIHLDKNHSNNSAINLKYLSDSEFDKYRFYYNGISLFSSPQFPKYLFSKDCEICYSVKNWELKRIQYFGNYSLSNIDIELEKIKKEELRELLNTSDFSRKKFKENLKEIFRRTSDARNNGSVKKVKHLETGKIYYSVGEASRDTTVSDIKIYNHANELVKKSTQEWQWVEE